MSENITNIPYRNVLDTFIPSFEIFHADCLEQMKSIPDNSIDLILCDLPYRNDTEQVG